MSDPTTTVSISPGRTRLADVLRAEARAVEAGSATAADVAELLRCLARLIEGKSLHQAFGAPGDFGYDTAIGQALKALYRQAGDCNLVLAWPGHEFFPVLEVSAPKSGEKGGAAQ